MNTRTAKRLIRLVALSALISSGPQGALFAESADATSATTTTTPTQVALATAASSKVHVMEKFTVKGVADEDQIMPTVRPISSVMGDERNILDTPRSVSTISKELMEQVRITSVTDFSQFAPGVYTAARYGLATTPMVRGDLAELYFNGQRAKYSRDSVMPSFNGVEAIDIVKGPGSAVYGPQSNGAAGYTNFVTKMPTFTANKTEVSLSYGSFTADHDFSNLEWQVDSGGPLSDTTALRVSYLGREGDTYYQNTKDNTQDIYVSAIHKFSSSLTLEWWGQWYHQTYGEVSGINRMTQSLLDNGTYIAGVATYNPVTNIFTIAHPILTHVDAYKSLVGTADIAHADRWQTQFMFTKDLGTGSYLRNLTYLETRTSDKYEPAVLYSEKVKTDWNVQNRTEYHKDFDTGSVSNSVIAGVDLKEERLIAWQSFFGEQDNLQDLTQPSSTWSNVGSNIYVFGVPGDTKFGSDVGYGNYGGNQDSKIGDYAVFYQHDIKFTPQLSFVVGLRMDHIKADDKSPDFVDLGGYGSPGTYHPTGQIYNLSTTVNDGSYFLSGVYKLSDNASFYVTYNRINAVLGSPNFGGVTIAGTTEADLKTSLKSLATLFEVGYKWVAFENRLYSAIAGYHQVRADPDRFGHVSNRTATGIEAETVFQESRNFSIIANATYQDVFRDGSIYVFQTNTDYYRLQPDGSYTSPGGGVSVTPYKRRYSGTPNVLANLRVFYRFDNGLSFGVGPQFTSSQKANAEGTLIVPNQYKVDCTVGYDTKNWSFQVNIDNITNEHNWTVSDPEFTGNTIIYQEKPMSLHFTTRHTF